jgi:predicted permease
MLLVLLGAINVTALTVARAADRAREFGLRAALGASRAALVRLWLVEATTVALVGGVIGVLLAQPLVRVTASLIPWYVQLPKPLEVDWRVAVFAMLAAVLPLALTAIGPAVTASRRAVAANLTVGHRGTSARRPWSRDTLLVAESAIGTTLVLVGSLILAGYMLLRSEDVGFDPERLAIVELARARGETPDVWNPREMRAFDRIRQVPSVRDVAMVGVPFLGRLQQITPTTFAPPDRVGNDSSASRTADGVYELPISGAFFEIAGLRLLEGRYPTRQEIDEGQAVAALNQKAARVYFGDRPPVSKTLYDGKRTVTVVGIVEHALFTSQWRQDFAQIYFPIRFKERPRRLFLVQTEGRPDRVATAVGAALKRDVPGALLVRAESMDEALALGEPTARFNATLFGVAGGAALLLVVVGVGGLVATNVSSRVRELGIRTALGAKPAQLIRLVVGAQIRRVVLGLALGLVCSWWTTKLVRAYRYDAHDARVWAVATLIILAAAIIAAWLPARRASRVNAVVALRAE